MPKQKSHSASKKRYKKTGTGKIMRAQAFKQHILTKKSAKRTRQLRRIVEASPANYKKLRQLLPY